MDLFSSIDQFIVDTPNGWCSREKARTLALLIMAIKPALSVEIGVYTGKSAIPMAMAHQHIALGQVLCIDPWSVNASTEGYDGANGEWWSKLDHESIYQQFTLSVIKAGVSAQIEIKRAKSDHVEPPKNIGLLHVDGQHTVQAIRDVERYAPNVIRDGFCVMDDITWGNGEVAQAALKLLDFGFEKLFDLGTGAVFQRLK